MRGSLSVAWNKRHGVPYLQDRWRFARYLIGIVVGFISVGLGFLCVFR